MPSGSVEASKSSSEFLSGSDIAVSEGEGRLGGSNEVREVAGLEQRQAPGELNIEEKAGKQGEAPGRVKLKILPGEHGQAPSSYAATGEGISPIFPEGSEYVNVNIALEQWARLYSALHPEDFSAPRKTILPTVLAPGMIPGIGGRFFPSWFDGTGGSRLAYPETLSELTARMRTKIRSVLYPKNGATQNLRRSTHL